MTEPSSPASAASPAAPDPPSARPSLPVQRAFVVQLRADADPARGVVRGRIEHIISGTVALFESVEELLACLRDALTLRARAPFHPPAPDATAAPRRATRRAS